MLFRKKKQSQWHQAVLKRARKTHCGYCGRNDRWFIREDPDTPGDVLGVVCACDGADYIPVKNLPR